MQRSTSSSSIRTVARNMPRVRAMFARLRTVGFPGAALTLLLASPARGDSPTSTVAGPPSSSQPSPAAMLSDPPQLAAWLRTHDATVAAADAHVEAATAARAQAGVLPNPQLQLAVGGFLVGAGNGGNMQSDSVGNTTNLSAGITELIELGKRGPRQQAASLRIEVAGEDRVGVLGARIGEAMAAIGKVAYLSARHDTLAVNLDAQRKILALEKIRLDHQDLSGDDYARLELETERLELDVARAEAGLRQAAISCAAALRAPCLPDGLGQDALEHGAPAPDDAGDVDAAVAARATFAASRDQQAALRADAALARRRSIPDPTVGVVFTHDNLTAAGNEPNTVLFSLAIPLPVSDRGNHDAAASEAEARALAAEETANRREARGAIDALVEQKHALEAEITRLSTESIPRSEKILADTHKAFDLGQDSLADLILAERAHRELILELLDARYDLFTARSGLRQALGLDDAAARTIAGGSQP
jgi:outer membrane protein, heavy metal efflux system